MKAIVKGFVIAVFAATTLALVTATPSEALKQSGIEPIDECTNKSSNKGCEGAICYCCITEGGADTGRGCYICDRNWGNCSWDPAYLKSRGVTQPGQGVTLKPLTTVPPRRVKPAPGVPLQKSP